MPITPKTNFGSLVLRDAGFCFVLDADFVITLRYEAIITAPKGTVTDGASIPRFFWRLIGPPMTGRYRKAAIIHDAGYTGSLVWTQFHKKKTYTRKEVDALFLRLMKALGVSWWRRRLMYWAVRWFGGRHWTKR